MASFIYNRFKANILGGLCDLDAAGDTIKVALMATGHSVSDADDDTWANVSANEMSGTGYTTPGQNLAGQTVTEQDASDNAKFDGTDIAWTTATFSAYYAVLYDDTLAGDDLICSFDFGGIQQVTAGTFTIQWHADGIMTVS